MSSNAIVASCAYIGQKGYTIHKNVFDESELCALKESLILQPAEAQGMKGRQPTTNKIYTYRENKDKIYIPRFYGIEQYGLPQQPCKLSLGETISVPFTQSLRDYQEHIVSVYTKHVAGEAGGGAILEVPCGRGKCLGRDTPILLYSGMVVPVQDIQVGDVLMGDDSSPRNVLSLARGRENMYRVTDPTTSEFYIVNESHILSIKHKNTREIRDICISDFLQWEVSEQKDWYGYRVPVEFKDVQPFYDTVQKAYLTGYIDISSIGAFQCDCYKTRLWLFAGIIDNPEMASSTSLRSLCMRCGIPLTNDIVQAILYIARSLGIHAKFDGHIFTFTGHILYMLPVRTIPLQTKIVELYKNEPPNTNTCHLMYPLEITPLHENDYYGFEIDGNRRFVLGDFTVTHNTIMALNICSRLSRKTLILVHKEFLMNQWIERIRDFVPSARVGIIQGKKFDIEEKDIVLGMIQTLYNKDYPLNTFNSFGLTIIDEVHRIGSEEFSKTLTKIVTPYMLGISATVDRKDGLTDILYMFIGPKIYHEERSDEDVVQVRAIQYASPLDHEFNEVEYDYRGNVRYSTMISRISDYLPRSEFLLQVMKDLVYENKSNRDSCKTYW